MQSAGVAEGRLRPSSDSILTVEKIKIVFGDEANESRGKLEVLGCSPPTTRSAHRIPGAQTVSVPAAESKCSQLAQHLRGGESLC